MTNAWVLTSVSLEDPADYDKRFEPVVTIGVYSSLPALRRVAARVAEEERGIRNDDLEPGEAEFPPAQLTWTESEGEDGQVWQSDRVEYSDAFYFRAQRFVVDRDVV